MERRRKCYGMCWSLEHQHYLLYIHNFFCLNGLCLHDGKNIDVYLYKLVHFQFVKECIMHDTKCRMHYRHYETIKHFTVTTTLWLHQPLKSARQKSLRKKVGEQRTFFLRKVVLETEEKSYLSSTLVICSYIKILRKRQTS